MITIETVNKLPGLVDDFGDIAEHAPWVAESAATDRPFVNREAMIAAFHNAILNADQEQQMALIRAHPDLAGKAKLTKDSQAEQKGAGLDTLTHDELDRFTRLNDSYKARFGFPFIFAVKGADKFDILESFQARMDNDREAEFAKALEMVCTIVSFRLYDKVAP